MQPWTADKIRAAVAALHRVRPVYAKLLGFHEALFIAQEEMRGRLAIEPVHIPRETLALKRSAALPLIDRSEFVIDVGAAGRLFERICEIALQTEGPLAKAAAAFRSALETGDLDPKVLFEALIEEREGVFAATAARFDTAADLVSYLAYNSVKPSLMNGAEQLAVYLEPDEPWNKGYCPVCGALPALALFGEEGQRLLCCSFCWHQWPVKRLFCPYCENRDAERLHYFFSEQEEEYRVDVCNGCGKYLKGVDVRRLGRPLYPPLEQAATLHLDIKARELGHQSAFALNF
jgi:FdhE protein